MHFFGGCFARCLGVRAAPETVAAASEADPCKGVALAKDDSADDGHHVLQDSLRTAEERPAEAKMTITVVDSSPGLPPPRVSLCSMRQSETLQSAFVAGVRPELVSILASGNSCSKLSFHSPSLQLSFVDSTVSFASGPIAVLSDARVSLNGERRNSDCRAIKLATFDHLLACVADPLWVGQGAQGAVLKAQWRAGCTVAVKWIVGAAVDVPAAYMEALLGKMLAHPFLVQTFDYAMCQLEEGFDSRPGAARCQSCQQHQHQHPAGACGARNRTVDGQGANGCVAAATAAAATGTAAAATVGCGRGGGGSGGVSTASGNAVQQESCCGGGSAAKAAAGFPKDRAGDGGVGASNLACASGLFTAMTAATVTTCLAITSAAAAAHPAAGYASAVHGGVGPEVPATPSSYDIASAFATGAVSEDSFDGSAPLESARPVDCVEVLKQLGAAPGKFVVQIVSEWCDEGTLHAAIRRGVFRPQGKRTRTWALRALLRTAREVAMGMCHLHSLNIIHGDLKPGNVLLKSSRVDSRGFVAKVADFGLSRLCGQHAEYVSTAQWGTVPYMAGEYLDNKLYKSSDVYSFGVLLWQMYTAKAPFAGHHEAQVAVGVMMGNLQLEWPASMPPPLLRLGQACCLHEPEQRPTFKEVVVALAGIETQVRDVHARTKMVRCCESGAGGLRPPAPSSVSHMLLPGPLPSQEALLPAACSARSMVGPGVSVGPGAGAVGSTFGVASPGGCPPGWLLDGVSGLSPRHSASTAPGLAQVFVAAHPVSIPTCVYSCTSCELAPEPMETGVAAPLWPCTTASTTETAVAAAAAACGSGAVLTGTGTGPPLPLPVPLPPVLLSGSTAGLGAGSALWNRGMLSSTSRLQVRTSLADVLPAGSTGEGSPSPAVPAPPAALTCVSSAANSPHAHPLASQRFTGPEEALPPLGVPAAAYGGAAAAWAQFPDGTHAAAAAAATGPWQYGAVAYGMYGDCRSVPSTVVHEPIAAVDAAAAFAATHACVTGAAAAGAVASGTASVPQAYSGVQACDAAPVTPVLAAALLAAAGAHSTERASVPVSTPVPSPAHSESGNPAPGLPYAAVHVPVPASPAGLVAALPGGRPAPAAPGGGASSNDALPPPTSYPAPPAGGAGACPDAASAPACQDAQMRCAQNVPYPSPPQTAVHTSSGFVSPDGSGTWQAVASIAAHAARQASLPAIMPSLEAWSGGAAGGTGAPSAAGGAGAAFTASACHSPPFTCSVTAAASPLAPPTTLTFPLPCEDLAPAAAAVGAGAGGYGAPDGAAGGGGGCGFGAGTGAAGATGAPPGREAPHPFRGSPKGSYGPVGYAHGPVGGGGGGASRLTRSARGPAAAGAASAGCMLVPGSAGVSPASVVGPHGRRGSAGALLQGQVSFGAGAGLGQGAAGMWSSGFLCRPPHLEGTFGGVVSASVPLAPLHEAAEGP